MTSEPNDERDTNREKDKDNFLYPRSKYRGHFSPQELVFDANLQEFAQKVSYICGLESNGKLSAKTAYEEIRKLVHQLKQSKKELLDDSPPPDG
jgi:spore maturation protein CgeB